MSDPLYDLLSPHLPKEHQQNNDKPTSKTTQFATQYLSRLLSLSPSDLTTTEPQSLTQGHHSNNVSLQALSSRSHKSTTTSATHLSTLQTALPTLTTSTTEVRESIPTLDEAAVNFAKTYSRGTSTSTDPSTLNSTLQSRKDSMLLSRQADKLTDILDLPSLLSTAIASASSGAGGANYSQALDLSAHIKRLSIVYPDSALVRNVQAQAEIAMKDMTTNLLMSLRASNIRLAAAIRTVGWLRRVVPELGSGIRGSTMTSTSGEVLGQHSVAAAESPQAEGSFGALFLVSRLHTFLATTEALAPLRELADQETERRLAAANSNTTTSMPRSPNPQSTRRPSTTSASHGTHTERYLKRYIEVFREQSFSTISMYRNVFPQTETNDNQAGDGDKDLNLLALPSVLQQFPLHLVEIFMEVLRTYLPNVTDPAARESLLMQVLYAANSLGRLGADFSMMISLLDEETKIDTRVEQISESVGEEEPEVKGESAQPEPEWARIIKKHRVQAARLDALAAGQNQSSRRTSDVAVR